MVHGNFISYHQNQITHESFLAFIHSFIHARIHSTLLELLLRPCIFAHAISLSGTNKLEALSHVVSLSFQSVYLELVGCGEPGMVVWVPRM